MDLHSNRLRLIQISESHIPEIHRMNSIPEVARYNTIGIPSSMDVTSSLLQTVIFDRFKEKRSIYGWALYLKNQDVFVGEIGMQLSHPRFNRAEVHYSLLPDLWGRGLATEGVSAVLDFAFNTLKLHRVDAGVAVDNIGSIRVLEKLGMQREGRRRKILPLSTGWSDNFMYAILSEDVKNESN